MKTVEQLVAMKSLTLGDFVVELNDRIYDIEKSKEDIIKRQIELEQCVYTLLAHRKPSVSDYSSVVERLAPMQIELRNPDLYNRALHRETQPVKD